MFGVEDRFQPPEKFAGASDMLHELVAKEVGSSDFGSSEYRMGLRVVLYSFDHDARFSERGRVIAWGQVINALRARALATREKAKIPHLDKAPVTRPVMIIGVPRTGTTALHKLLALDPQFQGLQTWLLSAPMPRPPRETWETNPQFQRALEQLAARYSSLPDLKAAHNMVAEEVDECLGILGQSFVSNYWCSGYSMGWYDAWWQSQSERPSYRYYRRILQLVGSNEPEKQWLLKNPGHIANLDLLFETFPDALVIQTHRDPAKAVPSLCGLLIGNHRLMSDAHDPTTSAHLLGHRETGKWSKAVRDAEPVRRAHPGQILDVIHGEFHRDPMSIIRRVYSFAGLELKPEVEAAMQQRIVAAPERSHGEHRYNVADFGLTEDEIREQFGAYIDQFDLRPKSA